MRHILIGKEGDYFADMPYYVRLNKTWLIYLYEVVRRGDQFVLAEPCHVAGKTEAAAERALAARLEGRPAIRINEDSSCIAGTLVYESEHDALLAMLQDT